MSQLDAIGRCRVFASADHDIVDQEGYTATPTLSDALELIVIVPESGA